MDRVKYGREHFQSIVQTVRHGLCLIHIAVDKSGHLVRKGAAGIRRAVTVSRQVVEIASGGVFSGLHIVYGFCDQIVQFVDGVSERFRFVYLDIGFHLSHDTADILSAVYGSLIFTQ